MRHRKSFNHLSRKSAHRKAMLSNMATSLIIHKRINTTLAKAKALREYVEPLITKSKEDSTHNRRVVFSYLQDKEAVTELFREVSPKVADRPGGYTRILKTGTRQGDNAEMALIELVDYNEVLLAEKDETKSKSSRRRRSRKKTTGEVEKPVAEVAQEVVEDTPDTDVELAEEITEDKPVEEVASDEPKAEANEDAQSVEEKKEEPVAEVKEEVKSETPAEEKTEKVEEETKEDAAEVKEQPKAEAKEEKKEEKEKPEGETK